MDKLRKLFAPMDMTEGSPWKNIVLFMIPMLIGNIAQQLYNTVDSIIVGKYVGDNALAAVGSAAPILNLLVVLLVGIGMGASIVVAQYLGAKQAESLSHSIGNCLILIGIASVIVIFWLFSLPSRCWFCWIPPKVYEYSGRRLYFLFRDSVPLRDNAGWWRCCGNYVDINCGYLCSAAATGIYYGGIIPVRGVSCWQAGSPLLSPACSVAVWNSIYIYSL